MINLLPPADKRQIRAGRSNALLIRYNFFLLGALGFLFVAVGFVYFYLINAKTNAETVVKENQTKVIDYRQVEQEANTFKGNLAIAKQILDKEVVYTKVILEISSLIPKGVVLDNLNLDAKTFGTETTLTARAKTIDDAIALKNSFQNSPSFSNVHFQSISTIEPPDAYPVHVSLNVTINKDAAK
jgi:Tfp pilus assembly protein PilN